MTLASFRGVGKWDSRRQWLSKCATCTSGLLGKCVRHSLEYHQVHKRFSISVNLLSEVSSTDASRAWTQSQPVAHGFRHTGHEMWTGFLNNSHLRSPSRSGDLLIPKGAWRAVCTFGRSLFISDLAVSHRAWHVTSQFRTFVSHCSSAFLWVIHLMVMATQLTVVLRDGSQVTCHSFLNLRLCYSSLSRPDGSLLKFESVILLVDSLYAGCSNCITSGWIQ
jgi:hypothetical protein